MTLSRENNVGTDLLLRTARKSQLRAREERQKEWEREGEIEGGVGGRGGNGDGGLGGEQDVGVVFRQDLSVEAALQSPFSASMLLQV